MATATGYLNGGSLGRLSALEGPEDWTSTASSLRPERSLGTVIDVFAVAKSISAAITVVVSLVIDVSISC